MHVLYVLLNKMNTIKKELRADILALIEDSKAASRKINSLQELLRALAAKRSRGNRSANPIPELSREEALAAIEVFHDLLLERVITPGKDADHPLLPSFRIHSEGSTR